MHTGRYCEMRGVSKLVTLSMEVRQFHRSMDRPTLLGRLSERTTLYYFPVRVRYATGVHNRAASCVARHGPAEVGQESGSFLKKNQETSLC